MTDDQLDKLLAKAKAAYRAGDLDGLRVSEPLRQRVWHAVHAGHAPAGWGETTRPHRSLWWNGWWVAAGAVAVALMVLAMVGHQMETVPRQPATQRRTTPVQASTSQLLRWNAERRLYEILWPAASSGAPTKVIFLLPNGFSVPRTFSGWPPKNFSPIAVLNDPSTDLGTGTGTTWFNMQTGLYWLHPASPHSLPTAAELSRLGSSSSRVLAVPQGRLFAVACPTPSYPRRTVFLRSDSFAAPTEISVWPPTNFRVVGVYPISLLNAHVQLNESSYPNPPHLLLIGPGVRIPGSL